MPSQLTLLSHNTSALHKRNARRSLVPHPVQSSMHYHNDLGGEQIICVKEAPALLPHLFLPTRESISGWKGKEGLLEGPQQPTSEATRAVSAPALPCPALPQKRGTDTFYGQVLLTEVPHLSLSSTL